MVRLQDSLRWYKANPEINLKYSTFGAYEDKNKIDEKDGLPIHYVFSYGQITPDSRVPKQGFGNYVGKGIYGTEELQDGIEIDAILVVNFDEQKVAGTFYNKGTFDNKDSVLLNMPETKINGASFSYSGQSDDSHLNVLGHFYGPNADEIGGSFDGTSSYKNQGFMGSFGAVRRIAN